MNQAIAAMVRVPDLSAAGQVSRIATLGPAGTSSEAAVRKLSGWLPAGELGVARTQLYPSYEAAAAAVLTDEADLLVVANAYANIAAFYMDTALCLMAAFVHHTPQYGIAVPRGRVLPPRPRVASHPAPTPLIGQLLPIESQPRVVVASSTSAAALAACAGEVDAALTTAVAAELYNLQFVSATRSIEMLWSVFQTSARRDSRTAETDSIVQGF